MFNRRNFVKSALIASLATKVGLGNSSNANFYNKQINSLTPFFPCGLKKNSKIAFTAPASPVSLGEIQNAVNIYKKQNCSVVIGETIKNRHTDLKYFSAPDDERALEFMEFIKRKDIDAIICGRGGYGVMRILPFLDFEVIKDNPKIIMGYSDITALVNAIHVKTGLVTYHGPVAAYLDDSFSISSMVNGLFNNKSTKIKIDKKNVISKGDFTGRIVGGNLSMITSTLGTPYEIDTKNSILFIEETSEEPYKIDKMLTHLDLAGKLNDAKAFVFGYFKNLNSRRNFFPGLSFTVKQIIEQRFSKSEKPCLIEMPIGHTKNNMTLPIGSIAELNTSKMFFEVTGGFINNVINN